MKALFMGWMKGMLKLKIPKYTKKINRLRLQAVSRL